MTRVERCERVHKHKGRYLNEFFLSRSYLGDKATCAPRLIALPSTVLRLHACIASVIKIVDPSTDESRNVWCVAREYMMTCAGSSGGFGDGYTERRSEVQRVERQASDESDEWKDTFEQAPVKRIT
jgi:hypothetical protein